MQQKHNKKLIVKVLIVCALIAILSYLIFPADGLSVMFNGESIAESLYRFASEPTLLLIMIISGVLMALLFLGVGVFILMLAMFAVLMAFFIMAPYFWPVPAIILLMITLMVLGDGNRN